MLLQRLHLQLLAATQPFQRADTLDKSLEPLLVLPCGHAQPSPHIAVGAGDGGVHVQTHLKEGAAVHHVEEAADVQVEITW